jgi:hypothetical protein
VSIETVDHYEKWLAATPSLALNRHRTGGADKAVNFGGCIPAQWLPSAYG